MNLRSYFFSYTSNCITGKMKRIVLFIIALMPLILSAQPRVNGKGPIKIEKVSQTITDPAGWIFDKYESQKWCGYYGLLWANYRNNDKKPIQTSVANKAHLDEPDVMQLRNISTIQMKRAKIDTTVVYLLYFSSWYVEFDYEYIRESPHYHKQYEVYLLSEDTYNMLWNLDTGINAIPIINHVGYVSNNEKTMLIQLNNPEYLTPICYKYGTRSRVDEYVWYVKKEDEKTIRFVAPLNLRSSFDGYSDFNKEYFEVSTATFNKLKIQ